MALALLLLLCLLPVTKGDTISPELALARLGSYGYSNDNDRIKGSNPFDTGQGGDNQQDWIRTYQIKNGLNATGVLDEETLEYLSQPRCGNLDIESIEDIPDSAISSKRRKRWAARRKRRIERKKRRAERRKRWDTDGLRWRKNDFTYFISYPSGGEDGLNKHTIQREFEVALSYWAGAAGLSFTEVGSFDSADFKASFETGDHGDGYQFHGPGGQLAHAFYPRDGRVHFDTAETWTTRGYLPGRTDLMQVAAHEFGHSLGFTHTDVPSNLMNPIYNYQWSFGLGADDIAGARAVYGDPVGRAAGFASPCYILVVLTLVVFCVL